MGRHRKFDIKESEEKLKSYKLEVSSYKLSQKLQALLIINSNPKKTLTEVANELGIHIATLQRWLQHYRIHGIASYLKPLKRNKASKITPEIHEVLEKRLHDPNNPFSSYVEVQEWLLKEYGVKIGYKWLWSYMTTKMNSKLKVPRKVNIKKVEDAETSFFKTTCHTTID